MSAVRASRPRRALVDCSNTKLRRQLRVLNEDANDEPLWTGNPFAPDSDISELNDTNVAILDTLKHAPPTSSTTQQPLFAVPTSRPRPAPIYKDKQHEEYWAFLKTVPEIQTDQLPPLSRCPSLMSGGALSSRNSSTRSTRSSIWDPAEDHHLSIGSDYRVSGSNELCVPNIHNDVQLVHSTEQASLRCPVSTCERHIKGFAWLADREQHVFKHFEGNLDCGFCTDEAVSFSETSDRVGLFLAHLVKKHGAKGQHLFLSSVGGQCDKGLRRPSFEGPVATCSVCTEPFSGAQGFYEHLSGCILREILRNETPRVKIEGEDFDHEDITNPLDCCMESGRVHRLSPTPEDLSVDLKIYDPYISPMRSSVEAADDECEDIAELTVSSRCLSLTSSRAVESSDEETDWTEEQTSRESSPGESQLPRRLSPAKRRVVENIMQEFQRLFSQGLRTHTVGESSNSSCSTNGWSSNSSIYSKSSFASRKRSLSGGGSTPPNDDEDSNKRRRPDSKIDGKKPLPETRFACPYYKRNPGRHQTFTSCRDPGFTTVARLKEHLYRRHLLPPQCHRCCTTFSNDVALREHQRDIRGCEVQEQVPLEGFDKDQERRLKSKKKSQVYQTEEEKWKTVYRVLFPDDGESDIPTPYIEYQPCTGQAAEPSNVVRFQEFSRLELPRLVRRTLEAVVEQEAQPLEDKMKERLVDIVKECQNQLLSMFQAVGGPSTEASSAISKIGSTEQLSRNVNAPSTLSVRREETHAFEGFDSLYGCSNIALATFTPPTDQLAGIQAKLPRSSNSSDSGYDSNWQPPRASNPNSDAVDTTFTLSSDLSQHGYLDLEGYFGLFENRLETTHGSSSMMNVDPCSWSFIEPMPGSGGNDVMTRESFEETGSGWHM